MHRLMVGLPGTLVHFYATASDKECATNVVACLQLIVSEKVVRPVRLWFYATGLSPVHLNTSLYAWRSF